MKSRKDKVQVGHMIMLLDRIFHCKTALCSRAIKHILMPSHKSMADQRRLWEREAEFYIGIVMHVGGEAAKNWDAREWIWCNADISTL